DVVNQLPETESSPTPPDQPPTPVDSGREGRMQFLRDWMQQRNKVGLDTALDVIAPLQDADGQSTASSQSLRRATLYSSVSSLEQSRRQSLATSLNEDFPSLSSFLPSDRQDNSKRQSYKSIAAAEPGHFRTGDVVEVVSKKGGGDDAAAGGKGDLSVVRKCPWRVPSDEPCWGENTNGTMGNLASDRPS
ncbi:MAG: hypothetical protein Q9183_006363, partial [Haloplaca sp. 2 TL-2023]